MADDRLTSSLFRVSRRLQQVQSPIIPVVGDLIRAHPGTISLGQGVVHYAPPPQAFERMQTSLSEPDYHKYKAVGGIAPLTGLISEKLGRDNGITIDEGNRIIVTAGGNMGYMNAILAITDPGDEVIIQRPYYFNHEMAIMIAGAEPVSVDTTDDGQPIVEAIERAITPRTRAITTISPNNPTGAMYDKALLHRINALCKSSGLFHIHDEAYEYFTYGDAHRFSPGSIPGARDYTISLYSLSKSFGMASWRIGYMVIPARLEEAVRKIQDTILICPPLISQHAAIGAMEAGSAWVRQRVAAMSEVRELVLHELSQVGSFSHVPRADGAFYVLLTLDTKRDDMAIVERLIKEFGVAVIPGQTFGIKNQCRLRVAYGALEKETVAEGIGRLVRGLKVMVK